MRKPKLPRFRLAMVASVLFVLLWSLIYRSGFLPTQGVARWVGLVVVTLLMGVLAGAVYWFMAKLARSKAAPPLSPEAEELATLVANARKRLDGSEASGKQFSDLPLILLLGPSGGAKTSVMLEGGLSAELLAGNATAGTQPEPTRTANIWYSEGTLFVEVSSSVVASDDLWDILMAAVRPRRMRAYFTRQGQASRAVVVCISARSIASGGDAVVQLAQDLRQRLFQTSELLGVQLPVYVVFTKADEIPHFADFVRNFTDEEAHRVLGATLPYLDLSNVPSYAASQAARVREALEAIFRSLALKRIPYLRRESVLQRAASAYEFPREFRKLQQPVSRFLVELCQPSQLRVSPFLRGAYFVGRRTVEVDSRHAAAPAPEDSSSSFGATRIFSPSELRPVAARGGTRQAEQWTFLRRILRDVVLRDQSVLELTQGGSKVAQGRRLVYAGATAALVLIGLATTLSFFGNRALKARTAEDIAQLEQLEPGPPSVASLAVLDSVRSRVEEVGRWENQARPLRLRMGLYQGGSVYPPLRRAYFQALDQTLLATARDSVVRVLQGLRDSSAADSDYLATYDRLRAYLIITDTAGASTPEFLTRVLLNHTPGLDAERTEQLARAQYDFFARELALDNPFPGRSSDGGTVTSAREYLGEAGSIEPFYARMVGRASAGFAPVPDPVLFPGLSLPNPVPGAFTADGRAFVAAWLDQPDDSIVQTEDWVVGTGAQVPEASEVRSALRTMYEDGYRSQWSRLVQGSRVSRFTTSAQGASRIEELVQTPGSLGSYVLLVGTNQTPESLSGPLRPVQAFFTSDSGAINAEAGYSTEASGYLGALLTLGGALDDLAGASGADAEAAAEQVDGQAQGARLAARQLSNTFGLAAEAAPTREAVSRLLNEPIDWAVEAANRERRSGAIAPLNTQGRQFCQDFNGAVFGKFPLAPAGSPEASMDDLAVVFQRDQSVVWNLESSLGDYVERLGERYRQRADAPGGVTINPDFLRFYTDARRFSEALYPEGAGTPQLRFTLQPKQSRRVPTMSFVFDGRRAECQTSGCTSDNFSWTGSPNSQLQLSATVAGQPVILGPYRGTWALFRLFRSASGWDAGGQTHELRWTVSDEAGDPLLVDGEPAVIEATVTLLGGVHPVFDATFLNGLSCVARIAN